MTKEVPPWEAVHEMETATNAELLNLVKMLVTRVAVLESKKPTDAKAVTDEAGNIPRGKYKGRKHSDIVEQDPYHIIWLADKGFAEGLGYTGEHVERAKTLVEEDNHRENQGDYR